MTPEARMMVIVILLGVPTWALLLIGLWEVIQWFQALIPRLP
jgi:hypothetical protein